MRGTRRVLSAIAATLLAAVLLVPAQAALADHNGCNHNPDANGLNLGGREKVAVLIHGWAGEAFTTTQEKLDPLLDDEEWAITTFSYPETNTQWPDKTTAAECLRTYLKEIDAASGRGEATIYLVAHSMGGILARFALDPEKDPTIRTIVAGVVTLDTPHLGSPFGGTNLAKWIQTRQTGDGEGDAWRCLARHHPGTLPGGCGYAPYVPNEIPVSQIGGNVTLRRSFYGWGERTWDLNSDGIVWSASQIGYVASNDVPATDQQVTSQRVNCVMDSYGWIDAVGAAKGPLGFEAAILAMMAGATEPSQSLAGALDLAFFAKDAACGHVGIPTSDIGVAAIADALGQIPTRLPRWTIDSTGVGPLKLGGTVPAEGISREYPCPPNYTSPDGWNMVIATTEWDGDVMSAFLVSYGSYEIEGSRHPLTEAGISIGSTEDEVLAAYPDAQLSVGTLREYHGARDYLVYLDDVPLTIGTLGGVVDILALGFTVIPPEMCG